MNQPEPIVYVDISEVRAGKLAALKTAIKELVEFVRANEPQAIAYNVYLSHNDTQMTLVQVHPDSASMEFHVKVAGSAFSRFKELIKLSAIHVYGRPSDSLVEQLRQKALMLGAGTVVVHQPLAGFDRFGTG